MMSISLSERDQQIVSEYQKGTEIDLIAGKYSVTKEEVAGVCMDYVTQLQDIAIPGEMAFADPTRLFATSFGIQPFNPSELITKRGMRTLDRMRTDDQIKAAMVLKKMAVLSTGWEVVSPEGKPEDWEPTRFIRDVFEKIEPSLNDILFEILSAMDYGFSVNEKIFMPMEDGDFIGKIGLKTIKSKRPHSFDFVTDKFGNLLPNGLLQETPDGTIKLPVAKFVIYTYQKEFSNYYGTSDLEAAYRAYWIKDNTYKWLAMLLERFGIPPIFALYNPRGLNPGQIESLINVIQRLQAATSGAIPRADKDSLEMWSPQLAGQAQQVFIPALEMFNADISRALLMPTLIGMTPEMREGSFARAKVQFDVFMLIIGRLRQQLQDQVLTDQVIRPLVGINFNEKELPIFRFLPTSDETKVDILRVWGELLNIGAVRVGPEDETHMRKIVAFPPNPIGGIAPGNIESPTRGATDDPSGEDPGGPSFSQIGNLLIGTTEEQKEQIFSKLGDLERSYEDKLSNRFHTSRAKYLKIIQDHFRKQGSLSPQSKVSSNMEIRSFAIHSKSLDDIISLDLEKIYLDTRSIVSETKVKEFSSMMVPIKTSEKFGNLLYDEIKNHLTVDLLAIEKKYKTRSVSLREITREINSVYDSWVENKNVFDSDKEIKTLKLRTYIRKGISDAFSSLMDK